MSVVIRVQAKTQLAQMILALQPSRAGPSRLHGRHQQGRQHTDNGDRDE
jgi:hypothetical protein